MEKKIDFASSNRAYDFIFCYGSGLDFNPHFATYFSKIKAPFIANFHDPFPGHLYPYPYKKPRNRINILLFKLMKRVLKKATKVSAPSLLLIKDLKENYNLPDTKLLYIPHIDCETLTKYTSVVDNSIKNESDKFTILHAGTLLDWRDPKYLIEAYEKFINNDPVKLDKSKLIFVGKISKVHQEYLESNLSAKNFLLFPDRLSYDKSLDLQRSSTANLLLEAISEESVFMPGKITDYIKANKCILALTPNKSEVSRLLGNHYPYKCEVNDTDGIYKILNKIWDQWLRGHNLKLDRPDLENIISVEYLYKQIENGIKG